MNVRSWPGPGFPGVCRKLTLAGMAAAPKISFQAPPRTHAGGQYLPLANAPSNGLSLSDWQINVAEKPGLIHRLGIRIHEKDA